MYGIYNCTNGKYVEKVFESYAAAKYFISYRKLNTTVYKIKQL